MYVYNLHKWDTLKNDIIGSDKLNIILASASERRQELIKRLTDNFKVIVSNFNEDEVEFKGDIESYVKEISLGKARDILHKVEEPSLIIGVDTVVSINNSVLGKPKDEEDAFNMLKMLSGNTHEVYSGITIINTKTNEILQEALGTKVTFSNLKDEEIRAYIETKEPLDKAGAYGIQGKGGVFVEEVNGCYYNIVGLPLNKLKSMIEKIK